MDYEYLLPIKQVEFNEVYPKIKQSGLSAGIKSKFGIDLEIVYNSTGKGDIGICKILITRERETKNVFSDSDLKSSLEKTVVKALYDRLEQKRDELRTKSK